MINGFKEFILRGNVIDLAVAVVIGAAFTTIVNAIVTGIFNPIIGVLFDASSLQALGWTIREEWEARTTRSSPTALSSPRSSSS
ncbi:MscL family protein [Rathayibacter oskolensis]|uniref:MscL family protein n=1 Tax=Rathayibacter oskolensis TaxID=1891671 RepID=UPI00265DAE43|nr:MscL family protein [Rathayibacter oskolensis]WKK71895.1 MscL family protein [Rathayibacter oskolensis]